SHLGTYIFWYHFKWVANFAVHISIQNENSIRTLLFQMRMLFFFCENSLQGVLSDSDGEMIIKTKKNPMFA
ncbi:MAG: hypothetical protein IJF32_12410, partial [Oscillospiraceae bacterium]|nr:hypothetical protein [Oscillospiraceae bacterium]